MRYVFWVGVLIRPQRKSGASHPQSTRIHPLLCLLWLLPEDLQKGLGQPKPESKHSIAQHSTAIKWLSMPAISHKARHPNIIRIRKIHGSKSFQIHKIDIVEYSNRLRILKAWAPDIPNNHVARDLSKEFPSQWHASPSNDFHMLRPTEEAHSKAIHLPWRILSHVVPTISHVHDVHAHWNHGAMVGLGRHHLHHCVHYLYLCPCIVDKW